MRIDCGAAMEAFGVTVDACVDVACVDVACDCLGKNDGAGALAGTGWGGCSAT